VNNNEIKALISLLDDNDKEISLHVEHAILNLGETIVPFLEQEWEKNFNPIIQKKIEEMIHVIQFSTLKTRIAKWKNTGCTDLLEGLWVVATYQYPDLEYETIKEKIEQVYFEVWREFKTDLHPYDQVKILNSVFFSNLKFSANTRNFHAISNSMINAVLESKKGNPISLCVIYMLIAQKLSLPIYGVNLPNLFILVYKTPVFQFYINVFNKGIIFSKEDIDNYIQQLNLPPSPLFYDPCTNLDIVKRVLRNMIVSFEQGGDNQRAEEVKMLLMTVSENMN